MNFFIKSEHRYFARKWEKECPDLYNWLKFGWFMFIMLMVALAVVSF